MNVLIPAKWGSSPLLNVGIVLSLIDDAPCNPISNPRLTSSSCFVVGMLDSCNNRQIVNEQFLKMSCIYILLYHAEAHQSISTSCKTTYLHSSFPSFRGLRIKWAWMMSPNRRPKNLKSTGTKFSCSNKLIHDVVRS